MTERPPYALRAKRRPSPVVSERGATWADWTVAGVSLTVCLALVLLLAVAR